MPGTLFVVATPIGNLEDVTARSLRILREVTLIAAEDTRRTSRLLARYAIPTPTTSLHEHNESQKSASLLARLKSGESIALVSDAGTPTVSDPGAHLIRLALDAGIRVESIPGPSAAVTALAAAGVASDTFLFLGFPPTRARERMEWLEAVRTAGRTVVFFEAPHRILRTLQDVLKHVGDLRATVARELTKAHEELVVGPISEVLLRLQNPRGEMTVVLEVGQMNKNCRSERSGADLLASEFGVLTENRAVTRREAVAELARRHGLSRNVVYSALEAAKKSLK
jgi:16S rRNA (cytidine1402-2'-O)-methyltransferase